MPRNYDAQGRPENTLTNPVGSVSNTSTYREGSNSRTTWTDANRRHTGQYSDNNPYFDQMRLSQNKQDTDALYERAIEWEADYANRQMQLEENRAILEEQRQYDSPVEQVARQRAAGINPDLEGSSGGSTSAGSSAQLTNPGLADQTGQNKFSNLYDNAHMVFEGINTAGNFLGTMATSVSGIMNAVSTMKMLPSQIAANEAHADLQGAQANEIRELLAGKKKGQTLSNIAQGIQNSSAIMSQLASFADLIAPDTPDMAPHLTALGVPEAQIPAYTDFIKQMHANPKMRAQYAKASTAAKFSEAQNDMYTQDLVSGMVELQYKMEYEALDLEYHRNHLNKSIASLLDTDSFATDSAQLEMDKLALAGQAVGVDSAALNLKGQQIQNDTEAFLTKLEQKASLITNIRGARDHIYEIAKGRSLTPEETAMVNRLNAEEMAMYSLASSEFNQIKTTFLRTGQALYDRYRRLDASGNMNWLSGQEQYNFYSDITFNDIITHGKTKGEIAREWTNTLVSAAGTAAQYYIGYRIGNVGKPASLEQKYKYNSKTGSYEIEGGTVRSYGDDQEVPYDIFRKKKDEPKFNFKF